MIRDDLNIIELQNLSIEIRKPRSKAFNFIVTTWYRPPCSTIEIFNPFEVLVQKLELKNVEFYILNLVPRAFPFFGGIALGTRLLSLVILTVIWLLLDQNNPHTNCLLEIVNNYNLDQLITEATRITPMTQILIIIGLVLTNRHSCWGLPCSCISDHNLCIS